MKIAIRLDDISEDMDWKKFLRFKGLLDMYGIKPLIGVIPDNKDTKLMGYSEGSSIKDVENIDDFWSYIRNLRDDGYVIAMHGVNHLYTTRKGGLFPLNHNSEFAGLSFEEQYARLNKGKEILDNQGISTDIFMAPSHSYDRNTLKALKRLGFDRLTDGFGKSPYRYKDIIFYPISHNRSSVLSDNDKLSYTTFVYHTNTMQDKDFEAFERLLDKYDIVSYNELFEGNVANRGLWGHLKEYWMADIKRRIVKIRSMKR